MKAVGVFALLGLVWEVASCLWVQEFPPQRPAPPQQYDAAGEAVHEPP